MHIDAIVLEIKPGWKLVADVADLRRWVPAEIMPTITAAADYAEKTTRLKHGEVLMSNDVEIKTPRETCIAIFLRHPPNPFGFDGHVWIGTRSEVKDFRRKQTRAVKTKPFTIRIPADGSGYN